MRALVKVITQYILDNRESFELEKPNYKLILYHL